MSRRAPGRAADTASAAWTSIASSDGQSMSMWCDAIAWSTASLSPCFRRKSTPISRWVPCISGRPPCRCRGGTPPERSCGVEADLPRQQPGDVGDLLAVVQNVLAVRRPVLQTAHHALHVGPRSWMPSSKAAASPPAGPFPRTPPSPSRRLPRCAPGGCRPSRSAARWPASQSRGGTDRSPTG